MKWGTESRSGAGKFIFYKYNICYTVQATEKYIHYCLFYCEN